ncbi:hypothetical protein GLYMA_09G107300v4 [Glycine max]|uniref:Uncharacterized protein n=1 Tax=Glycine max TaxID=3847 RepID=I1L2J6_SOYBN|nr:hypothetical protein GLYMA_09G107300v4 [Glycine max]
MRRETNRCGLTVVFPGFGKINGSARRLGMVVGASKVDTREESVWRECLTV